MVAVLLVLLGARQGGDETRGELQCCSSQGLARGVHAHQNTQGYLTRKGAIVQNPRYRMALVRVGCSRLL